MSDAKDPTPEELGAMLRKLGEGKLTNEDAAKYGYAVTTQPLSVGSPDQPMLIETNVYYRGEKADGQQGVFVGTHGASAPLKMDPETKKAPRRETEGPRRRTNHRG